MNQITHGYRPTLERDDAPRAGRSRRVGGITAPTAAEHERIRRCPKTVTVLTDVSRYVRQEIDAFLSAPPGEDA